MVSVILVFKETTELSSRVAGVPFHIPASNVWGLLYHILISIWSCHYFSYSCSNMGSSTKFLIMKQKHYPTENTVVLKTEYEVWGNLTNSGKIIHKSEMGFPGDSVVKNPCRRHKSDMYTRTHMHVHACAFTWINWWMYSFWINIFLLCLFSSWAGEADIQRRRGKVGISTREEPCSLPPSRHHLLPGFSCWEVTGQLSSEGLPPEWRVRINYHSVFSIWMTEVVKV